jgi:NADPH-dependent curcumin reductase CurA
LGRDLARIIETLGSSADTLKPDDPVHALLSPDRSGFAEYVLVKATDVAPKSGRIDAVHAGAVPLTALMAWQGLSDHSKLQPGLGILSRGGGVGHFAIQFAKARGATVFTTVSGKVWILCKVRVPIRRLITRHNTSKSTRMTSISSSTSEAGSILVGAEDRRYARLHPRPAAKGQSSTASGVQYCVHDAA